MKPEKFSIKARVKSFYYAFRGLFKLFKSEHNSRIHLIAGLLAILSGAYLQISTQEWISISIVIALVLLSELFNTSIEKLADKVEPKFDEQIGTVKDFASAAVLIASILSVIVGGIIFIPKFLRLF